MKKRILQKLKNKRKLPVKKIISICLFLINSVFCSYAQLISVTGKVTDGSNQPLIGAAVQVSGSSRRTVTDMDGNYSLKDVEANGILQFSYLGFANKDVEIKNRTQINVVLEDITQELSDVVVVGYGTMRKRDLTGAITSISSENIEMKSPVDISDALQGASAGVQITTSSGAPGADADIRIRGTSTFGAGTLPLYIVDGMPMEDISGINPQDIASIEILKDASSAAIYGSRSANGVIIITSKRGSVGQTRIDIKYQQSYGKITHCMPLTTPDEARFFSAERYRLTNGVNGFITQDSLKLFFNGDGRIADYLFQTSEKHRLDLSISGATDKSNYYLSTGFFSEDGVIVNSSYKRFTLRANAQYNATKKLLIGNKIQMSYSKNKGASEEDIVRSIYNWMPNWNLFDADGNIMHNMGGKTSAYAVAMNETNLRDTYKASALIFGEYSFNKYLKFTSNASADLALTRRFYYKPTMLLNDTERTTGRDWTTLSVNFLNENYFSYNRSIGNHTFSMLLGNSVQMWRAENVRVQGLDYSTDLIYTLNAASAIDVKNTYSNIGEHAMLSYFNRGTYSYAGKYLFTYNLRYDGSSRFGSENRFGLFPSGSVGWRISDEPFFDWSKPALYDAKIRVSYGLTGNENIGDYDSWQLYSADNYYDGTSGIAPVTLAYPELGWEKTSQLNIGLDLVLIQSKLKLTFDYYNKNTTDLLYNVEIPKETGYKTMRKNIGAMNNTGYEFSIDYNVLKNKNWNWNVNFNISTNNSKIVQLADGIPFYTGTDNAIYVQEGHQIGEFYGFRHDGVFAYNESNAFDENWNRLTPTFSGTTFTGYELNGESYTGVVNQKVKKDGSAYRAGDVNWLDNADDANIGVIDENDKVYLGCAQPDFFGGLNSTLSYKKITLYFSIYYSIGGDIYNRIRYNRNNFQNDFTAPEPYVLKNMWLYPGDNAIYPIPTPANTDNRLAASDYWIENGSYVKLQNLRLSYNVPKEWCEKVKLYSASIQFYGNNLMTFSKYKGFDPEFGSTSPLVVGIDTGRYPRKIELGAGLNLRF